MVKLWCQDYTEELYTDAGLQDSRRLLGVPLAASRSLIGRFPEDVKVIVRSKGQPTDFFMAGPMPVVSQKLKDLLDTFRVNAEFFSVRLIRLEEDGVDRNWFCLNILATVDCLDWKNSRFTPNNGFATNIERVSLVHDSIGSQPLFRVAKTIPSLIAVSAQMADALIVDDCSGVVFKTPEDWKNPMRPV